MKKINKYSLYISLCSFLAFCFSSCDMDVVPPTDIATETYWKTDKDAWYNLNAVYRALIPSIGIYGDSYTEDVFCQYPWESDGHLFQQDALTSDPDLDQGWDFIGLRKANIFLENVDLCEMDDNIRTRMKAEARFLRANDYLEKTLSFGKVPIITEVLSYDAPGVPRNSVEEVRKFILDELTEVANILPEKYSGGYLNEKGRITRYAALSLKARAALYFGDYVTAESAAREVMTKGGYSLFRVSSLSEAQQKEADEMSKYVDFAALGIDKDKFVKGMFNYEALWHTENGTPDNPEYILTRQYVASSWDYQDMTRYLSMRPNQLGGWSSVTPTQNLVDAYWTADGKEPTIPSVETRKNAYNTIKADLDAYSGTFKQFVSEKLTSGELMNYDYIKEFRNRDSRLYVSILLPFKGWYETTEYGTDYAYQWIKGGNNESKTGFNFRKMLSLEADERENSQATGDFPSIRYAEVLLIFAEARTHTTGYDAEVRSVLNDIRDRCGMPDVPASLSKDEALSFIRNERRIELAGEGRRSDDLSRYEDAYWQKHMSGDITAPDATVVVAMKWSTRMRLRPLPQSAIDLNPNLVGDQNPGY